MGLLVKIKFGTVGDQEIFLETVNKHFTTYYKPMVPLVDKLRQIVFPNYGPWKMEDEKLYSRMREVLREGREDLSQIDYRARSTEWST
jgi:hypothetical protein